MIRWILLLILACFSSASYATCASGSMRYASPLIVDLSDKLYANNDSWSVTYTTQYAGTFNCTGSNSKFGYTKVLSTESAYQTILGFNNNKDLVRAEIIDAPSERILAKSGSHSATELNTSFTLRFTRVSSGKSEAIAGDTAQLSDVLFVTDLSGMTIWELPLWLIKQLAKILIWLFNGFHWPYDSNDMFGQPMTIKYAPKLTTCSFNNAGLTVKLPTMGLQQVIGNKNQPGLTPFMLNFSCKDLTPGGTADRAIEMFLSSTNQLSTDSTVLVDNNTSAAKGIGLRLVKRDTPQLPVRMSSSTTVRGTATALFSVQAGGLLSNNLSIPMAAYYYAWDPVNATHGNLNTSATLNIIYP